MQRFTELEVWQRGHKYLLALYDVTRRFPHDERYVLSSQIRRAALSVPANVAEGSRRAQPTDYARFLNYAQGSLSELESHLMAARDLGYVPRDRAEALIDEAQQIGRMLYRLREKVLAKAYTLREHREDWEHDGDELRR